MISRVRSLGSGFDSTSNLVGLREDAMVLRLRNTIPPLTPSAKRPSPTGFPFFPESRLIGISSPACAVTTRSATRHVHLQHRAAVDDLNSYAQGPKSRRRVNAPLLPIAPSRLMISQVRSFGSRASLSRGTYTAPYYSNVDRRNKPPRFCVLRKNRVAALHLTLKGAGGGAAHPCLAFHQSRKPRTCWGAP